MRKTDFIPAELIKKKRNGGILLTEEIAFFVREYTAGKIPDYQMSALLMAIYFRGMQNSETLDLTRCMLESGSVLDLSEIPGFKVDKHSTGGVGDKTSLILGPIVAACGLSVPMISGRGLGHTGGTLDKLESIPGFNTQLSLVQFREAVAKHQICFIGQTKEICPADKKIYALRDVTATIESLPLICASIMSKKLAEGIDGLVLDVKYGVGSFMQDPKDAETLARALMAIATGYGKKISTLITKMNQPLGRFAGNAVEVDECVQILRNENLQDPYLQETRELSLRLSAKMLWLGSAAKTAAEAYALAEKALTSGNAYEKFLTLCQIHGGRLSELPRAKHQLPILAKRSGYIASMQTEKIGLLGIKIKAGRAVIADVIEPTAGIEFHAKIADQRKNGDPLFTLYGADLGLLQSVADELEQTIGWSDKPVPAEKLILKEIDSNA